MENISATRERKEKIVETSGVGGERSSVPENVTVVQSVYDAFGRGDVQALFGLFHPKGEIYQSSRLPWGGVYRGYEGLGDFIGKLTGVVESRVDTERYIDDKEGHVVAVGHTRGRVRATGREFDVPETHVWTIKKGKVMRFEAYIDTPMMREALEL